MKPIFLCITLVGGLGCRLFAAVVGFESDAFEVSELNGRFSSPLTLVCTPPPDQVVQVQLRAIDGVATIGADYQPYNDLVVAFAPHEGRAHLRMDVVDDGLPEPDETVRFEIVSVTGADVGARSTAVLTIRNAGPELAMSQHFIQYGQEGESLAIPVERRGDTNVAVSVAYATTTQGAAIAGADFLPAAGRLEFAPGERTRFVVVALPDNGAVHAPHTKEFEVRLADPVGATLDPTPCWVSIGDDETPATVDLSFDPDFTGWAELGLAAVAVEEAGTIVVAGRSRALDGEKVSLRRLNVDGSVSDRFRPPDDIGDVFRIIPTVGGKILVVSRTVMRLLPDGTLDVGYGTAGRVGGIGSDEILAQLDGKIVHVHYGEPGQLGRLNVNGSVDSEFDANVAALRLESVGHVVEHLEGRLLVVAQEANSGLRSLIRLNRDGTKDTTFLAPEFGDKVGQLLPLSEGRILVPVLSLMGTSYVRLHPDGRVDEYLLAASDWGVVFGELDGRIYFSSRGDEIRRTRLDGSVDPMFSATWHRPGRDITGTTFMHGAIQNGVVLTWHDETASSIHGLSRKLARIVLDDPAPPAFACLPDPHEFGYRPELEARTWNGPFAGYEADGAVYIVVHRFGDVSAPATIRLKTQDGTAVAGVHYAAIEGVLAFAPLQNSQTVAIPLLRDPVFRGKTEFTLRLSEASIPTQLGPPVTVRVYDAEPRLVLGRMYAGPDGTDRLEYDVTSELLTRDDGDVPLERSRDLVHWTPVPSEEKGGWYQQGRVSLHRYSTPYLVIPPGGNSWFFRVRLSELGHLTELRLDR